MFVSCAVFESVKLRFVVNAMPQKRVVIFENLYHSLILVIFPIKKLIRLIKLANRFCESDLSSVYYNEIGDIAKI